MGKKENKALLFKEFIGGAGEDVKLESVVEMALSYKITRETINQKVTSQVNAINYGIKKINSKFTEKSKNYDIVKEQILDSMTRYEEILNKIGNFYDGKIEQLITRKLELQTNLIGNMAREQYLKNRKNSKNNEKNNEKIKSILTLGIKKAIERIKEKKEKSRIDASEITNLMDKEEIEKEQMNQIDSSIDHIEIMIKENKENRDKMTKEIYLITTEIKRLNQRKKEALLNAMEADDKWMVTKIKKPKTFEKITRFFSSRINTPKVIKKTLIDPLNQRIDNFERNELSRMEE